MTQTDQSERVEAPEWVRDGWLTKQLRAWPARVDPERTTSLDFLLAEAACEIDRLASLAPADPRPITMQDVRLAVGEGKLTPADVLAGCNAELRRRAALAGSPTTPADPEPSLETSARLALMYLETGFVECERCGNEVKTDVLDATHELRDALSPAAPEPDHWMSAWEPDGKDAPADPVQIRRDALEDDGWQSIETAPIGVPLLVWGYLDRARDDGDPPAAITAYIQESDQCLWATQGLSTVEAEWWRPLPAPPAIRSLASGDRP